MRFKQMFSSIHNKYLVIKVNYYDVYSKTKVV